ncbi:hypothetical protein TNCV_1925941 [Trichonephila clavipes]|nr:hypothetical protein TNCV_1925941 [Trichonephila clavipes]
MSRLKRPPIVVVWKLEEEVLTRYCYRHLTMWVFSATARNDMPATSPLPLPLGYRVPFILKQLVEWFIGKVMDVGRQNSCEMEIHVVIPLKA